MSYRQHAEFWWRGAGGSDKVATIHTAANPAAVLGGAADILAASQACSAGYVEAARLVPSLLVGGSLGSSPYGSCADYLKLQLRSAGGELVDYHVPAPLAACFSGADLTVVSASNPLIADLIDALITNGASSSGSPLASFVRGGRYRIPHPRGL